MSLRAIVSPGGSGRLPRPTVRLLPSFLLVLAAVVVAGPARAGVPEPATPPPATSLPDSAVLLPWEGSGTEDDPFLVDIDELISQGQVVIITPTDTVPVGPAETDTVVVTAAPIRVSEVVRRIGERMQRDWSGVAGARWTELLRTEAIDHAGDPEREERTVTEEMSRVTVGADGEHLQVRLWRRERRYRGGELVSDKTDSTRTPEYEWPHRTINATMDAPFALLTADRYRYRILERTLIGDHLIYRIGFEPRSRFQPGLKGQVWIDYGEFAIRRMEGSIAGISPAPLFVKEVPRFRLRQREVDGRWLPADFSAEVVMRKLPLLPDRFRFQVTHQDYVLPDMGDDEDTAAAATAEAADGEVRP